MDDLISRQAAIEAIEEEMANWDNEYGIGEALNIIKDLPSAQPTHDDGSNALDALEMEEECGR